MEQSEVAITAIGHFEALGAHVFTIEAPFAVETSKALIDRTLQLTWEQQSGRYVVKAVYRREAAFSPIAVGEIIGLACEEAKP